jgi:CO/xanthine dehydrogenase Mo-binding subunit
VDELLDPFTRTGMIGLRMHHDGTCAILGQSADIGVNRDTTYALVVADELGLNYEDVYMSSWETPASKLLNRAVPLV